MELRNITFEFDKNNDLMVQLNEFRQKSPEEASLIVRQLFDNACIEAGLESDNKNMVQRINKLMMKVIKKTDSVVWSTYMAYLAYSSALSYHISILFP